MWIVTSVTICDTSRITLFSETNTWTDFLIRLMVLPIARCHMNDGDFLLAPSHHCSNDHVII